MLSIEELKPQLVLNVSAEELGLLGYVVIDRLLFNSAIGGVRIREGLSLDEVANLGREMHSSLHFLIYHNVVLRQQLYGNHFPLMKKE
ncbi:MAG: hypothetical protein GY941_26100 [Planctomycetes bacterium]|nr:hypothetical protein [Planctomycetota bacterium]